VSAKLSEDDDRPSIQEWSWADDQIRPLLHVEDDKTVLRVSKPDESLTVDLSRLPYDLNFHVHARANELTIVTGLHLPEVTIDARMTRMVVLRRSAQADPRRRRPEPDGPRRKVFMRTDQSTSLRVEGEYDLDLNIDGALIELQLDSCIVRLKARTDTLKIQDETVVIEGSLRARRTIVPRAGSLEKPVILGGIGPSKVHFGTVTGPGDRDQPVHLFFQGEESNRVDIVWLPPKSSIRTNGEDLHLGTGFDYRPGRFFGSGDYSVIKDLMLRAWRVTVHSNLVRPYFAPLKGSLDWRTKLRVVSSGRALECTGTVTLYNSPNCNVTGARRRPINIVSVRKVTGANLDNVNLSQLPMTHIERLRKANRVVPYVPWPLPRRPERPVDEKTGLVPTVPRTIVQSRLARYDSAYFWANLADLVKDKHCPGHAQAKVRLAAIRCRRKSVRLGREKLLLTAYSFVGYGELLFRPILVYLFLAYVGGLYFRGATPIDPITKAQAEAWTFFEAWVQCLLLPLTFFRPPSGIPFPTDGLGQLSAAISLRVAGLVLIGFFVLATRRIVRLE
jgi:hypothetical protein